jgi:hypothetical protein
MPSMSEITVIDKPQANGPGRFAWRRTFFRLASDLLKTDLPLQFGGNGHFSAVSMRERSAAHEGEAL